MYEFDECRMPELADSQAFVIRHYVICKIMDPVHLVLAFAPLGLYLIGLGVVHWRRRPLVLTGSADVSLLAFAVVGLVIVGPMEFLLPAALPLPGKYVWLMLLLCYSLLVTLWNLLARPRLIVLNVAADRLRPILGGRRRSAR